MHAETFQVRIGEWMKDTFSEDVCNNRIERAMSFFEEATELCQSIGMSREQCEKLIEYVFARPVGETYQEIGGTMVTLAALGNTVNLSIMGAGEKELARISTLEVRQKIQAKQVTKAIMGTRRVNSER